MLPAEVFDRRFPLTPFQGQRHLAAGREEPDIRELDLNANFSATALSPGDSSERNRKFLVADGATPGFPV